MTKHTKIDEGDLFAMSVADEEWRRTSESPNHLVSSLGRVYSKRTRSLFSNKVSGRYAIVFLDGNVKKIHRLVAQAFVTRPDGYDQVNHKDGIKANNKASNLEWVTRLGNMRHAAENGLYRSGQSHHRAKLDDESVREIRASSAKNTELAERFSISPQAISSIRLGRTWRRVV